MSQDSDHKQPDGAGRAINETWEKRHPEDARDVDSSGDDPEDGDTMDEPLEEEGRSAPDAGDKDENEIADPAGELGQTDRLDHPRC